MRSSELDEATQTAPPPSSASASANALDALQFALEAARMSRESDRRGNSPAAARPRSRSRHALRIDWALTPRKRSRASLVR